MSTKNPAYYTLPNNVCAQVQQKLKTLPTLKILTCHSYRVF